MKVLKHVSHTYEAVDGTVFDSEIKCKNYENSLPKDLVFCLEQKYTHAQLVEQGYYELGYTSEWTTAEYEAPAFLREGGEYVSYHSSDTILKVVFGDLTDVVAYAVRTDWANYPGKFIRKIEVTNLNS